MTAKVKLIIKILIHSTWFSALASGVSGKGIKNFSKCIKGERFTHKNTAGYMKILICTGTKNGVPQWQYCDGSSTLGDVFNPARDCSDIVDNRFGAKNGFYWIILKKGTHQVWCDVHTDGGGFMLVGMKNSPVSWTVPSNSTPVDPQGYPNWSSELGDVNVLDFRVQFSIDKSFEGTKANWMYRLNPQRKFGNIFSVHNNGCPYLQAGIGNISFVKDLMTESVLTTNFTCSKFGPHTHQKLGWGRMNYCLLNKCKYGYAIFSNIFRFRYDKFGSYSFSVVSPYSGMNHDSTAFVGCDQDECCACFGPKGGRRNYCSSKCTTINGGTVIKRAFVWFWVRTRMPKRLWKRCMEFTITNSAGKRIKYHIDKQTSTAHKGTCSEQFKALLNEGTLYVSDKQSFEKIPDVPGLLSYRADNKQLYVNQGSKWQALSTEEEVFQLNKTLKLEVESLKRKARNHSAIVNGQENELMHLKRKIINQEFNSKILSETIKDQERKIEVQNKTLQTDQNAIKSAINKIREQEKHIQVLKNKTQSQETKIQIQKNGLMKLEKEYQGIISRMDNLHPPKTCSILRKNSPTSQSGTYKINAKDQGMASSFQVYCDMSSKNGVGVTVIGHDSEARIKVDGYESAGAYRRKIKYDIPMEQIVSIISQSKFCEQFVKYKCYNAGFWFDGPTSWWVSRQGSRMTYWGGAVVNSGKCACGITNSCLVPGRKCNCDNNINVWTEDSGYLPDKNTLPVSELRFGDTDTFNGNNEYGYLTIGKLRCWG